MIKSRITIAYIFIAISFFILFARYAYLQIFQHGALLKSSVANYSSTVPSKPVRGSILDRNNNLLAGNYFTYAVGIRAKNSHHVESIFNTLTQYIELSPIDKKKFKIQLNNSKGYDQVIIKDDLSQSQVARLTAHSYALPNLEIFAHTKRYYPFKELYAPSVGYISHITAHGIKSHNKHDYLSDDYIGKDGLEYYYESKLHGSLGRKIIKTDAVGNEISVISNTPAIDGNNIKTTLDSKLQSLAWQLLGKHQGAIVALNPTNGEVLAFVSKPSFDPNLFTEGMSSKQWYGLIKDENNPFLNRALQGTYPPGSTFKPFLALSALYLGIRTPNYKMDDPGYFIIPGSKHRFRDSQLNGLGVINLATAIKYSSDAYFYKLGLDMGIDNMDKTLTLFGFGRITGIDLPNENPGLLPSRQWKAKRFAKNPYQRKWQLSDSVTMGIGQGFNHYTPLQMAVAVSAIANNGVLVTPHLLDAITDKDGKIVESYTLIKHKLPMSLTDIQFIKKAMQSVVTHGTASGPNIAGGLKYTMAAKTGTAQVVALNQNNRKSRFSGEKYKDHAWFIAFAPVDHPKIAVAIIVEHGGWGASAAGPIARKLFDAYLLPNPSVESHDLSPYYRHKSK